MMSSNFTFTSYVSVLPSSTRTRLRQIRTILKKAAPKAKDSIKWRLPALSDGCILYMYAGFKNHIGLYPTPAAIKKFEREIARGGYKTGKGSIQFPLVAPLPVALIAKIAAYRVKQVKEEGAKWM